MNFFNPVDITMYPGARSELLELTKGLNVLVICTEKMFERIKHDELLKDLVGSQNIEFEHKFSSNPSLKEMMVIAEKFSSKEIHLILGIGGGSTMDVAKTTSMTLPARRLNYSLENLLKDSNLMDEITPVNCFQIPTTAGTGSEVTPFATIWDYEKSLKKSLSHMKLFPKRAIVDSYFLQKIPLDIALSTGLDALNQALESLWNINANELTKTLAIKSILGSLRGLKQLDELGKNTFVADDLAMSSLFAGLCISQTRTSICHSISYPLTLNFCIPHGLACAFSMLEVLEFNSAAIRNEIHIIERQLNNTSLAEAISAIFEKYGFYSMLHKYMSSEADIIALLPEMVTPTRAGNNIRRFKSTDLKNIILKSCARASI